MLDGLIDDDTFNALTANEFVHKDFGACEDILVPLVVIDVFDERAHPKAFFVLIGVAVEHQVNIVLAAEGGVASVKQLLLEGAKLLLEFIVITYQLLKPFEYSVALDGGTDSPTPVFEFNVGHGHI